MDPILFSTIAKVGVSTIQFAFGIKSDEEIKTGIANVSKQVLENGQKLDVIQHSIVALQSTTTVIGLGVATTGILSGVNFWQTLKLRNDIKQLGLNIDNGFIDLTNCLQENRDDILRHIDKVSQESIYQHHKIILSRAYSKFCQAIQNIPVALEHNEKTTRNTRLANISQSLNNSLVDYKTPELLKNTSASGKLRRYECSWIIEQAIALTHQLQDSPAAASKQIENLRYRIRENCLSVIEECDLQQELDLIFPEIYHIYNYELVILEAWQQKLNQFKNAQTSPDQLASLQTIENPTVQQILEDTSGAIVESPPPEITLYEELKQNSHPITLRDQLTLLFDEQLRRDYEQFILQKAKAAGLQSISLDFLKPASNAAIANLYWDLKSQFAY